MTIRDILLLGNPKLYEICSSVREEELTDLESDIRDLRDTLLAFRAKAIDVIDQDDETLIPILARVPRPLRRFSKVSRKRRPSRS